VVKQFVNVLITVLTTNSDSFPKQQHQILFSVKYELNFLCNLDEVQCLLYQHMFNFNVWLHRNTFFQLLLLHK